MSTSLARFRLLDHGWQKCTRNSHPITCVGLGSRAGWIQSKRNHLEEFCQQRDHHHLPCFQSCRIDQTFFDCMELE